MNGAENAAKGLVFVSYCHDDREWLRRFRVMLAPVARNGQLEVWADDQILAGDRWRPELEDAIRRARIALLLVSPEFLASRFIVDRELPALREQGARLVPVLLRQCLWRHEPLLAEVQWAYDPDRDGALAAPHPREWDGRIVRVCNRLLELLPADCAGAPAQAATAATERLPAAAQFGPVEAAGHAGMVGLLDGAPPLPAEYVARAELAGLIRALLEPGSGALGLTGNVRALGLHGQGGIGKTVLAAALAHDERVRAHFPDGAFWVTMGERANLVATQLDLLARLGLPDAAVRSAHDGLQLLKETLAGRRVLLVVDDVWSGAAATAFRATGPGGRVLYTTRDPNVLAKVGARLELVEVLSVPVARQLLARITGDLATALPAEADRVLAATGRVALAVALVGAAVRGGVSWAQAAAELDRGGETFLDHPYANTFKALQLATGALAQQLGEAYLSLAVYPRDTRIPVAAVARYWRQLRGAPPEQTRAELQMLAGRELLTLGADEIAFHDLEHDYLLLRVDDLSLRHADLLAIYRALIPPDGSGEWWQLPRDEPYIWDHLIHHLSGSGDGAEIVATVTDLAYLTMRIALGGQHAAEDDLALALTHCSYQLPGDDRLLRPLLSRIRQSIDLLERCDSRESFCPTLAGRLQDAPELADFAAGLSRCVKDSVIHVEGPPHDTDDRRLVGRLPKRGAGVKALSWLAEPDRVGVAFRDGAVRLWEPSTHKLHQSMGPDLQRVTVAAWVNSRGLIAIGRSDGTVTVWPLPVGEGPDSLPDQGVAAVAWSKTGELAYAGWAGALARWSPRAGTQWLPPDIGGDRVTAMAWSDDGTQLAFGTLQGGVFSLSKDGPPQRLGEHRGGIASLTWSAEKRLAWAGWDGTVRVLEPDGSPSAVQPKPSDSRGPAVIAWDEDGHQLGIGGFDGAVAVWSAAEYRTVLPARSRAVRALAWSPRAPLLAAAHDGGVVQIWHETDRPHPLPIVAHQANVVSVAWSSGEEHLATAGSDGAVAVWAPLEDSGALLSAIRTQGPTTVRCSPDGQRVAVAERAGAIGVWDVENQQWQRRTLNSHAAWTPAVGWAPGGAARLATGGADGVVYEWNAERESDSTELHRHAAWVSGLAWTASSRGEQLATLGRDWVIHISQPPGKAYQLVAHEGGTTAMAWSPHGSLLATAGNDWLVRIWRRSDAASVTPSAEQAGWGVVAQFLAHLGGVTALEWAPGGTELATAGWDRSVRRWRLRAVSMPSAQPDGATPMSWRLMDTWWTPTSAVTALAWSPDGTSLVGGDRRGKLRLWRSGDPAGTELRSSHESPITALRWPKRANLILSTGTDGTLRLWGANGKERARVVFRAPLYSLDLHENSGLVAVGGEHGATILRLRAERRAEQTE